MATTKAGTKTTAKTNGAARAPAAQAAAPTNGGIVFQKLGKDFKLPTIQKKSGWEETIKRLRDEADGEVVMVYSVDYERARKAYTKNKALRKQAAAMGITNFGSFVRKQSTEAGDMAVIFAGVNVAEEEAAE